VSAGPGLMSPMKKSVGALYIGRLVSAGTTVFLLAIVGRLRGADALGIVGVGMAAGALLASLAEQGASMLVVRALAHRPERRRQIVGGLTLVRCVSVPVGVAVTFGVMSVVFHADALAITLAAAWLAVQQSTELTRAVLVWGGRAGMSGLHTSVENVIWVSVMTALLLVHAPLNVVFAGGLAVLLCSLLAGYCLVRIFLGWFPAIPTVEDLRQLLRDTPPFTAFVVLGQLYSRVDTLLIGALLPGGLDAAGAYFAAMRLIAGLEYLPDALSRAIYPNLARAYVAGAHTINEMIRRPIEVLLWISIPVPFAAFLAADWGFPLVFGSDVRGYSWVLVVVTIFVPMRFLGYLLGITLTTGGAQAKRALAVALAAVIVVGLDVVLLPRIGLVAAVIAFIAASITTFGIYFAQVWRNFGRPPFLRSALTPLGCSAAAFVAGIALRSVAPAVVAAPAALALFGAVYGALWLVRQYGPARPRAAEA
jgi:O-antigen/teichoic acid export membrane protein